MTVGTSTASPIHDHHEPRNAADATTSGPVAQLARLPRNVKIVGGSVIGLGALLIAGVPLATLAPLVALGGCLSMHLFMGHGAMNHGAGGSHGSHAAPIGGSDGPAVDGGPEEGRR